MKKGCYNSLSLFSVKYFQFYYKLECKFSKICIGDKLKVGKIN